MKENRNCYSKTTVILTVKYFGKKGKKHFTNIGFESLIFYFNSGKAKSLSFKLGGKSLKTLDFRITSRSSRSEVRLEISQHLQESTCARVSFLI